MNDNIDDNNSQTTMDSDDNSSIDHSQLEQQKQQRYISVFEYTRLVNYIVTNICVISCHEQFYPREYIRSYELYHQQWFINRKISTSKMISSSPSTSNQQSSSSSTTLSFDINQVHSLRFSLAIIEHQRVSVNEQQYINYSTFLLQR